LKSERDKVGKDVAYLPPGEGSRSLQILGELVAYKIASDQTGGAYSLFEVETPPGSGMPPHVQHREDEAFYVLEGEYEFLVDGRTIKAEAGSLIYVPKGNLHAHKNVGKEPGRMLASQTPGGLHERFFEEIGVETKDTLTPRDSEELPDMGSIAKIAAVYGIELPSPGRFYSGQKGSQDEYVCVPGYEREGFAQKEQKRR
jgi:quercetin dioxygenase-like cupin family protein